MHMKYFLTHEIMHALGLGHQSGDPRSIMFMTPTAENVYIFGSVFKEFDGDKLFMVDKFNLVDLFLEGSDRVDWMDKSSKMRTEWSSYIGKVHPECENWK